MTATRRLRSRPAPTRRRAFAAPRAADVCEPRVMLSGAPPNEPGNTHATAGLLPPSENQYTSTLSVGEARDIYRIEIPSLQRAAFQLQANAQPLTFQVYDSSAQPVEGFTADVSAGATRAELRDLAAGTYYVWVERQSADRSAATDYTFLFQTEDRTGTLPGTTVATAGELTPGNRDNHLLASQDAHVYRFEIDQAQHTHQRATLWLRRLNADLSLRVQRLEPDGSTTDMTNLFSDYDGTRSEYVGRRLRWGTYVVTIAGETPQSAGRYQLQLALTDPSDTQAGPVRSEAGTLNANATDMLYLSEARDYWKFTVATDRYVGISMGQLTDDLDMRLENPDGSVIERFTERGQTAESLYRFLTAGEYYLRVHRPTAASQNESPYQLFLGTGGNAQTAAYFHRPLLSTTGLNYSVAEDAEAGTTVATIGALDGYTVDRIDRLIDEDTGAVVTGVVTMAAGGRLDWVGPVDVPEDKRYALWVTGSDGSGEDASRRLTLTVQDVNGSDDPTDPDGPTVGRDDVTTHRNGNAFDRDYNADEFVEGVTVGDEIEVATVGDWAFIPDERISTIAGVQTARMENNEPIYETLEHPPGVRIDEDGRLLVEAAASFDYELYDWLEFIVTTQTGGALPTGPGGPGFQGLEEEDPLDDGGDGTDEDDCGPQGCFDHEEVRIMLDDVNEGVGFEVIDEPYATIGEEMSGVFMAEDVDNADEWRGDPEEVVTISTSDLPEGIVIAEVGNGIVEVSGVPVSEEDGHFEVAILAEDEGGHEDYDHTVFFVGTLTPGGGGGTPRPAIAAIGNGFPTTPAKPGFVKVVGGARLNWKGSSKHSYIILLDENGQTKSVKGTVSGRKLAVKVGTWAGPNKGVDEEYRKTDRFRLHGEVPIAVAERLMAEASRIDQLELRYDIGTSNCHSVHRYLLEFIGLNSNGPANDGKPKGWESNLPFG